MEHKVNILLVDDRPDELLALEAMLSSLGQNLVKAHSGEEALRCLLHEDYAVILLDLNMPGMDGFETAALIRQRPSSEVTPIIFVTALSEPETHASRGYSLGAVDYIHTPLVPEVLRTKVSVFVELYRKTEELKRQAADLRAIEAREHQLRLDDALSRLEVQTQRNLFFVLSVDMLCIVGFDGFFKQVNPAWEKSFGFPDAELEKYPLLDFLHPEDRARTSDRFLELQAGGFMSSFENRFRSQDGEYRWLSWTAAAHAPEDVFFLVARDITERRRKEAERVQLLVEEQRRASQLERLNAASLAISSAISIEATLQVIADQARQIVGAHQALALIEADDNFSQPRCAMSLSGDSPLLESIEAQAFISALTVPASLSSSPVRMTRAEIDPSYNLPAGESSLPQQMRGWLFVPLMGRDSTRLGFIQLSDKLAGDFTEEDEAALRQLAQMASIRIENTLYREAREANHLKDEFLAMLSHELRNPLNAMLGWTRLLQMGKLDAQGSARALDIIERNVKVQAQLIEELLDVSRIVTGKVYLNCNPLDFGPIVETSVDAARPSADAKSISLAFELEIGAEQIWGDADRLQQVVGNLLSNAVKFTPEGGKIEVHLRRVGSSVELSVCDSGEGISSSLLPHIFDRFRQGDSSSVKSHRGLGLGLTIVRCLVEQHGGAVHADSGGKGKGAAFVVRLPVIHGAGIRSGCPSEIGTKWPPHEQWPRLEHVMVLVVDDEADTRDLVSTTLQERGAKVTAVESAQAALDGISQFSPLVLVSDIAMPGEDGFSLIRKLRARAPEVGGQIPAIALTAYARPEDRDASLAAGFQMHVSKPIELAELVYAVAALSKRGRPGDETRHADGIAS